MFKSIASIFLLSLSLCAAEPNSVVATIPVGQNPAGIAITPDNRFAYIANNNNNAVPGGDTVSVLNLKTNSLEQAIYDISFDEPYTITINAKGTRAYVTNSAGSTVTIIDIGTNTVIGTIGGFDGPSGFAITPNDKFAYVNNYGGPIAGSGNGKTVNVVNLDTNLIVGTITVDQAPAALAITPDGAFVYVINYVDGNPGTGTINVIQTSTNSVVDTIPGFFGPFAIAITPNGKFAYVTNFGSNNFAPTGNTVSVVDLSQNRVTATIPLSIQPSGIAITPDGCLAYASNYNTLYLGPNYTNLTAGIGTVNIIDTTTNTVLSPTITVGLSPANIAISSDGNFAYVSNYTSNTVSVISLASQIIAKGCQIENRFLSQSDFINQITWSVSGTAHPAKYLIYRDAGLTDLACIVTCSQPYVFYDHHRMPNCTYTYYIVAISGVGTKYAPVPVTVSPNCSH